MAQSNSSKLGFSALISALCIARGVISDSLTFESLNPAINLAYIKKNCWNLDDPTIEFSGICKARARGSEGPSSATPPAPASSAPAPSLTPAPFTSAPPFPPAHSPAPASSASSSSFECRCSKVAWPGVQPSPLGGGEASAAQEPQPKPEVAHEATLEATPRTSPVTSPIVEVSEGEEGPVDIDYVADLQAAQSTWDPWPTAAQETPQPAQDTPSSPHGEPTPTQDDC
ncbi:proline-rich receptor-like protein kinase PERK8 [Glycine soja]|uniref:proline-rich receptor-like protein kinase PERK8 n=1 Tax=Glycine soja TaxID=3848 RepID=UPI00103ED26A|nr:proline-rich receptor-like protein kinase PERK8 [Glycine soja]